MNASSQIIQTLMQVIEVKDLYTAGHSNRVADYTLKIGREMGYDEKILERFYNGAILHDIGKIKISSAILKKTTSLTEDEYETMGC